MGDGGMCATGRSCSVSGKVERLLGRLKVAIVVVGRHLNLPTVNLIHSSKMADAHIHTHTHTQISVIPAKKKKNWQKRVKCDTG